MQKYTVPSKLQPQSAVRLLILHSLAINLCVSYLAINGTSGMLCKVGSKRRRTAQEIKELKTLEELKEE